MQFNRQSVGPLCLNTKTQENRRLICYHPSLSPRFHLLPLSHLQPFYSLLSPLLALFPLTPSRVLFPSPCTLPLPLYSSSLSPPALLFLPHLIPLPGLLQVKNWSGKKFFKVRKKSEKITFSTKVRGKMKNTA